ncbi:MAG: hypothetical protein VST68_06850 [Nitrospirota bacterium]|nr:hypothetical protein [Nitrospirota bacterium]
MNNPTDRATAKSWALPRSRTVQLIIAVAVLFWSGFFTLEFLLRGILTWPQGSRVVTLTLACVILAYEFVFKEAKSQPRSTPAASPLKTVCYSCLIPYMLGGVTLLALTGLR